MTLAEIKQAVLNGKTVCWDNPGYRVIVDNLGQWFVRSERTGFTVMLTNMKGELNTMTMGRDYWILPTR